MNDRRQLIFRYGAIIAVLVVALTMMGCIQSRRPPILMRHLDPAELRAIERGEMPCCFEIAIDHGQQQYPDARKKLIDAGKGMVTYFNVHDVQPQVIRDDRWRQPWFSFLADTVMGEWGAYLINADGDTAFYAFYGGDRYLLNWAKIDSARAEILAKAQVRAAGNNSAAFWDVYFPRLEFWMFSAAGPKLESFASDTIETYEKNLTAALRIARRAFKKNSPKVPFAVMANGDWLSPPPIYIEGMELNLQGTFAQAVAIWGSHPWNCASVKSHHTVWVDSIIARWRTVGGILIFQDVTPGVEDRERAYAKADSVRRGKSLTMFIGETDTESGPH